MQVTIRLEDDLVYSIARVASFDGDAFPKLVNDALRAYLEQHPAKPLPVRKAAPPPMP